MPLPCQAGRRRRSVLSLFVPLSVHWFICLFIHSYVTKLVNNILKTNKPIWIPKGQGHETFNLGGQEVKGQGDTRPKVD